MLHTCIHLRASWLLTAPLVRRSKKVGRMEFALPAHVAVPPALRDVVLARRGVVKKPRHSDDTQPYPFDTQLPHCTGHSSMGQRVTTLPIDWSRDEIVHTVDSADITVLVSETASGKTTRAPQFILDDHQRHHRPCRIVVAGQRRLAAREPAKWVATERGETLGGRGVSSVGYAVKDDVVLPWSWNSIIYVTEEKLLNVFDRGIFTHIFIDEAHERTLAQDTLLLLCRRALSDGRRSFKVILMTAWIDAGPLKNYFEAPPAATPCADPSARASAGLVVKEVRVHGRRFVVQRVFVDAAHGVEYTLGEPPERSVNAAVSWLLDTHGQGDVLVFVADVKEIDSCVEALSGIPGYATYKLHSKCTRQERERAMSPASWLWKIIVATNLAETSVTIPGVKHVVSYAYERLPPSLAKVLVSKASLVQREGRGGRNESGGVCLMMLPAATFDTLFEFRAPQAQRLPLRSLALYALAHKYIDTADCLTQFAYDLPSPPKMDNVKQAIQDLETYDLTVGGQLTLIGEAVEKLPLDIEIATALITGVFLGVAKQLALVLAAASTPGFLAEFCQMESAQEYSLRSGRHCESDLFAAGCFLEWHMHEKVHWTGNGRVLEDVLTAVAELRRLAAELDVSRDSDNLSWLEDTWPHVEFAFCSGFRGRVAVRSRGRSFQLHSGGQVKLSKKSLVTEESVSGVFYVTQNDYFVSGLQPASGLSLLAFGGSQVTKSARSVVIDGLFEMSCVEFVPEPLYHLRSTLASLLCAFLQGRGDRRLDVQRMKTLLCANEGPVACLIHRQVVSFAPSVQAETRGQIATASLADAHVVARARCSQDLISVTACPPCQKQGLHKASRKRAGRAEYEFFQAVSDGCLSCVRRELEVSMRVAPEVASESHAWTARDFANWAVGEGTPGASEVQVYLDSFWSHVPART